MATTDSLHASVLFNVKGFVCLVTGGGTGIGLMATQALAANGAKVYIVGRRAEALEQAAKSHSPGGDSGQIIPCSPCDVTKKEDLERLVQEIETKEDRLNLLVTAAGQAGPKSVADTTDAATIKAKLWENESVEAWNEVYSADVTSTYFTAIALLPLLQKASTSHGHMSPSILTISSMSGIMRHAQSHFSYNAAKGATVQLTKLMSAEFLKLGIRCNSIAPGYFPSEMTTSQSNSEQKSHLPPEKVQGKEHDVPAARAGVDEEMAQAVLFLAKNQYVNGEIVAVDGGVLTVVAGR